MLTTTLSHQLTLAHKACKLFINIYCFLLLLLLLSLWWPEFRVICRLLVCIITLLAFLQFDDNHIHDVQRSRIRWF